MDFVEAQQVLFCRHRNEWNLSQNFTPACAIKINTIASFVKVKISDFQTRFHNE